MELTFTYKTPGQRSDTLLLFFTGWGMDADTIAVSAHCCDVCVACDYRDFTFDDAPLRAYRNIVVVAWSLGVYVASKVIGPASPLPIARRIAVNGTPYPVSPERGIAPSVYQGTADNLTEASLLKFRRRMCGSSAEFSSFMERKPRRSVEALREELEAISRHFAEHGNEAFAKWDTAIISERDRIFLPEQQHRGWAGNAWEVRSIDASHLPADLAAIISQAVVDKELVVNRFSRKADSYDVNAAPQRRIAQRLFELWRSVGFTPGGDILEIGCGTGAFTRIYHDELAPHSLTLNDICPPPRNLAYTRFECGDIESIDFGTARFDYVVSSSAIHWLTNPALTLRRAVDWLRTGGLLVVSTFGSRNLSEVAQAAGVSLFYDSVDKLTEALAEVADVVVATDELLTAHFGTPLEVLRHLKSTGVNALRHNRWTKAHLERFSSLYPRATDGSSPLTFNPIYIIARKK